MDLIQQIRLQQRRTFLAQSARGMGAVALAALLNPSLLRARGLHRSLRISQAAEMAGRRQSSALPPEGQAGHLALHGRRPFAPGDLRLQAQARRNERQADAGIVSPRASRSRSSRASSSSCFAPQYAVQEVRQVRAGDLRAVPAYRLDRRRHLHHPLACAPRRSTTTRPTRS